MLWVLGHEVGGIRSKLRSLWTGVRVLRKILFLLLLVICTTLLPVLSLLLLFLCSHQAVERLYLILHLASGRNHHIVFDKFYFVHNIVFNAFLLGLELLTFLSSRHCDSWSGWLDICLQFFLLFNELNNKWLELLDASLESTHFFLIVRSPHYSFVSRSDVARDVSDRGVDEVKSVCCIHTSWYLPLQVDLQDVDLSTQDFILNRWVMRRTLITLHIFLSLLWLR